MIPDLPLAVALFALVLGVAGVTVGAYTLTIAKGYVTRQELLMVKQELSQTVIVIEDQAEAFKRFRSKVGMRERRDNARNEGTPPDPMTEPEAYRRHLEKKHAAYLSGLRDKQREKFQ